MPERSDNGLCPGCGGLGEYQGVGMVDGDAWDGTRVAVRYCHTCDERFHVELPSVLRGGNHA